MKIKSNSTIYIIALLTLGLSSCSKEETPAKREANSIYGKWFLEKSAFNEVPNELSDCEKQSYVEFYSDGTFERTYYYADNESNCLPEDTENGSFVIDEKADTITLSFAASDETEVLNNVDVAPSSLKYTWDEDGDGSDDIGVEYIK